MSKHLAQSGAAHKNNHFSWRRVAEESGQELKVQLGGTRQAVTEGGVDRASRHCLGG